MERADWLKRMQNITEALYDRFAWLYWGEWGLSEDATHQKFIQRFLERVALKCGNQPGFILSAACGAGRYDGLLLKEGHHVLGTDQAAKMLAKAREHFPQEAFPQLRYEKLSLQQVAVNPDFKEAFDGIICMDAMEHICPEDYPGILLGLKEALKPGGVLYFTADTTETAVEDDVDVEAVYERAKSLGLPVVPGEWVDEVEAAYEQAMALPEGQPVPGDLADRAVYHYFPHVDQVRAWIDQAGLVIEEEALGSGWHHFIASKKNN